MKNTNKKGFTIVELVIVIAVIAILAAVLIPTFVGLVNKANRAADTALAKELNTAIAMSETDVDTFDQAVAALREGGFILANLNAKADGCYFVWDDVNNQILYVDAKDGFKVLYSNGQVSEMSKNNWILTVSNKAKAEELKDANLTVVATLATVNDLADALKADGTIYMDESVILNKDNILDFSTAGVTTTLNLGTSQLTSNGTLNNIVPIQIKNGATVTINGGVIGAAGTGVDLDGKVYATPITGYAGSTVTINNTEFISTGGIQFEGTATLNNAKTNSYFYSYGNGNVTLNDCVVNGEGDAAIWVTNTLKHENGYTYDGASTLTVNGGKYTCAIADPAWGVISVYGGKIVINDGEFTTAEGGKMVSVMHANGEIVIKGGTFNGTAFAEIDEAGWNAMCATGCHATLSEVEGVKTVTISK